MRIAFAMCALIWVVPLAGCGGAGTPAALTESGGADCSTSKVTDLSREPGYTATYLHRWKTAVGCPVRLDVLMTRRGKDACGGERVADILMGWPLGQSHNGNRPFRIYVRDPEQVFVDRATSEAFDGDAKLPTDAVDTGYRQEGTALWMRPKDDSFLYLVMPKRVEAWPLAPQVPGCA
jgi:hypothetical protein